MLRGREITKRFDALGAWLAASRPVWSVAPFREHSPAWTRELPELTAWLLGLSEERLVALEQGGEAPEAPEPWPTLVAAAQGLSALGTLPADPLLPERHPLARRVKARKWAQVRAFLATTEPQLRGVTGAIVEGCAGKGHLGRTLGRHLGREAVLLERDPALCAPEEEGESGLPVRHVQVDVLAPEAEAAVPRGASVLGLHACGRLTDRLIALGEAAGAPLLAMAPCCPHRLYGHDTWCPRSVRGEAHGLALTPDDLHLAVLDEVVASSRRRALRRREMVVRVAVDLLVREATGEDRYRGFASVTRSGFERPLGEVVDEVARDHGLPLPTRWDPAKVEALAEDRVRHIRALGLVRGLYRRPIELWTILDRAQGLLERGRAVEVGLFCAPDATPRNVLILAG